MKDEVPVSDTSGDPAIVYVGTYTQTLPHVHGKAEGIYVYGMDRETGALHYQSTAPEVVNPSFLVVEPQRRYLYAVQEVADHDGRQGGLVSAFAIDLRTRALEPINHQPTHGAHPCYVAVDHTGRWLLVANYGGGSVALLPIAGDGALGPATAVVQHHGSSGETPHPHAIVPDAGNRFVLVPDAGLDRIMVYRLDTEQGRLVENDLPPAVLPRGTGPRHLAFHPRSPYVYSINERGSSVSAFAYDAARGELRELQSISTLPDGYAGRNACADIHIDPSGRYLYGSNRGHNSIAIFALDDATGELRPLGHMETSGRTPRNFDIDPTGTFLLAANQDSDTIVTFAIDRATGALAPTGHVATVPTPVCVWIEG
jgi:6-phosphogluconolactonase